MIKAIAISPRVWPTVAFETLRHWLRHHLLLTVALVATVIIAGVVAVTRAGSEAKLILGFGAYYVPMIAGLLAMSGIVADERASGLIVMWLQKRGSLIRAYLFRFLLYQLLIAALALILSTIVGIAGVIGGSFGPEKAVRIMTAALPMATIPSALVFAFSAWGFRRDSVTAAIFYLASLPLLGMTAFDHGIVARLVRMIAYPVDAIATIIGSPAYDTNVTKPIVVVTCYLLAWTLIGLVGLRFTERMLQRGG